MTTLREQIIEEMKARRIDHKTYTDADWLMAEYEKHIAEVLCDLLERKFPSMDVDEYVAIIKAGNWDKMYEAGVKAAQTKAQALIRQTLDPISSNER